MCFLQNYSHYTVLESTLKPADIVDIAEQHQMAATAITDMNTMAGVVQFYNACKDKGIKPILGLTLLLATGGTIVILAKNKAGYDELVELVSKVNNDRNIGSLSILYLEDVPKNDNLIFLDGHAGSKVHTEASLDPYSKDLFDHLVSIQAVAGSGNYYLQIEPTFSEGLRQTYQELSESQNAPIVLTNQIRYKDEPFSEEVYDIIRATKLKVELDQLQPEAHIYKPYIDPRGDYSKNQEVADKIEEYNILRPPQLPAYPCPEGVSSLEYLKELCREGYRQKVQPKETQEYRDRIRHELKILEEAGLADYFLILWDVIKYAEDTLGRLVAPGRGSSAGCLVSYLLGITKVDPIQYGLIFERFYNPGRIGSMPDIDVDFPKSAREQIISYIIEKYGEDRVGQIVTYQTLMGRAAIKAVLRAKGNLSAGEMNEITKQIEDKSKIDDELQQMKEAGREPSVIMWALENRRSRLSDWAMIDSEDNIYGELAHEFKLAIALEGIKCAQSRHAAGIVVGREPLSNLVPMLYDSSSKKPIVGLEYEDAEQLSLVKLDILGIASLDRLEDINVW